MKRKITAGALILISLISIVLVLVKTPILNIENYEDEKGEYLNYYLFSYKITKSREILDHIISVYAGRGDNYDKLKPLFDDAFEARDEFSQDTIEANAFTCTDEYYVIFLARNGKTEEANKFCDERFAKGEYLKVYFGLHSMWFSGRTPETKNFAFEKIKALVQSDMYQRSIEKEIEGSNMLESGKLCVWSDYVGMLFSKGEYDAALKEIEKMAKNKENGYGLIFTTLGLTEDSDDDKKNEFTEKAINILVSSGSASDEEIIRIKEYFLKEQK